MDAEKLMLLTAEQVSELAQTPHGLRLLAKIADAIDEYLMAEATNALIAGFVAFGSAGISMEEAGRNIANWASETPLEVEGQGN